MKQISKSIEETVSIAKTYAETLHGGEVIFLQGTVGSGKTTFVRAVVEYFGADVMVRSPSFTLMNIYPVDHKSIRRVIHLDGYRLSEAHELDAFGLEEIVGRPDTVVMMEWPFKQHPVFTGILFSTITFHVAGQTERIIDIV